MAPKMRMAICLVRFILLMLGAYVMYSSNGGKMSACKRFHVLLTPVTFELKDSVLRLPEMFH